MVIPVISSIPDKRTQKLIIDIIDDAVQLMEKNGVHDFYIMDGLLNYVAHRANEEIAPEGRAILADNFKARLSPTQN